MTINLAIRALLANKNRALLTMLGIIIGIASVIIIISAGQGVKTVILSELEGFGANVISATPGKLGMPGTATDIFKTKFYTLAQKPGTFTYVQDTVPNVMYSGTVAYKNNYENASVIGTTPLFFEAFGFDIKEGRIFTSFDDKKASTVVVLSANLSEDLFKNEDPIGKTVKIAQQNWTIIGVLEEKGGFTGQMKYVFAPLNTVTTKLVNADYLDELDFIAIDKNVVNQAKEEIHQFLRKQLDLQSTDEDPFRLDTSIDAIATINTILSYMTIFLSLIASISLLVGGIGIMNIMLVSVTERTREIGLRKAVGAKYQDILKQFLVESVILTLLGGLIGVLVGCIGSTLVAQVGQWPPGVPISAIIIAVGISTLVGIGFGFYPARKAARLDPILALRSE